MMFNPPRQSYSEHGKIYFFTATINSWKWLLADEWSKNIVIASLENLVQRKLIQVYAYVIMPNHLHLISLSLKNNGKESPRASFLKYTAHEFKKNLNKNNPELLKEYSVNKLNKEYEFWQRDPLSVHLYTRAVMNQKMEYIHNNPLNEKWKLAKAQEEYRYSSAQFYLNGRDEFNFLTHIGEAW